jgi:DNA-3-methyladenine glycosylase II
MPRRVVSHFQKIDPLLFSAYETLRAEGYAGILSPEHSTDLLRSLVRTISRQQLAGKAADTIWARVELHLPQKKLTSDDILLIELETLRGCGLSQNKAEALHAIATYTIAFGSLDLLAEKDAETIRAYLLPIKGVGPWTVDMFMMFSLGHEDVFSAGDLGLQMGVQNLYNVPTKPDKNALEELSLHWAPYRTYASRLLWAYYDTCVKKNL